MIMRTEVLFLISLQIIMTQTLCRRDPTLHSNVAYRVGQNRTMNFAKRGLSKTLAKTVKLGIALIAVNT